MSIILSHPFVNKLPNVDELLLSDNEHGVVVTIDSFCNKIKKLAKISREIISRKEEK